MLSRKTVDACVYACKPRVPLIPVYAQVSRVYFVDAPSTLKGGHLTPSPMRVVDVSRQTPEPWRSEMENRGIASLRDFARKSGLSVETIRKTVYGLRTPTPDTAKTIARTLGVPLTRVNEWIGFPNADVDVPYDPPAEATRLDRRQRKALDELIRSMVTTTKAGGDHDQNSSAPMNKDNVAPIVNSGAVNGGENEPPADLEELAADRGPNRGKELRRGLSQSGEESQLPPDEP